MIPIKLVETEPIHITLVTPHPALLVLVCTTALRLLALLIHHGHTTITTATGKCAKKL